MSSRSDRHVLRPTPATAAQKSLAASKNAGSKARLPKLPPKPEEMTWRDYLIMLLHIGAELEHALMVEYLYAAYSLGGDDAAKHDDRVREWRDTILTVAREEMGHLITVQNLLLLVGGPVSFERRDYPWSSPFYPFEFRLERLSLKSLACYVYAEMPRTLVTPADKKVRRDVVKLVGPDAPTVGEIYDRIIEVIGNEKLIPDSMFNADSYAFQSTWDEWGRGYRPPNHQPYAKHPEIPPAHERKTRVIVTQMATRTEALDALRDIAGQGEAEHLRSDAKMEESHFDRFARIFREYQAILKKDPKWSPSRPVPENPYAGEAEYAPEGTTAVSNPASMAWASLFNVRYRILLSLLTYTFRIPRDAPESAKLRRASMLARTFGEMYNLKAVAGVLVRLPLAGPRGVKRAGPPFQLPYTLTPPLPEANYWRLHLDLLDASKELAESLLDSKRHHTADAPTDGTRYLHAMLEADHASRTWIEGILAGIDFSRRLLA